MLDTKASLQDAETILQETLARLKEMEEREGEVAKSPQREEKVENIMEPSPQPSLGSYYNFFEAGKIIPQKFTVPLFLALEEERVRTHIWMEIAKSNGCGRYRSSGGTSQGGNKGIGYGMTCGEQPGGQATGRK